MIRKGSLIVLEGLDGSGKETQSKLLVDRLNKEGYKAVRVSFPNYGQASCSMVEEYLKGNYMNAYGYRNDHVTFIKQVSMMYSMDRVGTFITPFKDGKTLIDLLQEGYVVVCDRYTTSNILHQGAMFPGYNLKNDTEIKNYIKWVQHIEYKHLGLPRPDYVMFLNLHISKYMELIEKRGLEKDRHENMEHLSRVYTFKSTPVKYCRWDSVFCTRRDENYSLRSIEEIHEEIYDKVMIKLNQLEIVRKAYEDKHTRRM